MHVASSPHVAFSLPKRFDRIGKSQFNVHRHHLCPLFYLLLPIGLSVYGASRSNLDPEIR